jgi:hypothetical protein
MRPSAGPTLRRRARAPGAAALIALLLLLPGGCAPRTVPAASAPELWFYHSVNLSKKDAVPQIEAVWRRAAAAGYSKVMLVDPKLARLGEQDSDYMDNLHKVVELARTLKLEIVPGVFWMGRSQTMLALDPNLAEGFPVRDAKFVVHGGVAQVVADPPVALDDRPNRVDPGITIRGGTATIGGHGEPIRMVFRVNVAPWRCYHLSVQVHTQNYGGEPEIRVSGGGRRLDYSRMKIGRNQDWMPFDVVFDPLGNGSVEIAMGDFHAGTGTLEYRDWKLEEAGPVNVLRRDDTPFTIAGRQEGRDFEMVKDTLLGQTPWRGQFEGWHAPPVIRTHLPDGTELRASWYYAAVIGNGQVTACPSEPGTLELLRNEAKRVKAAFGANGYAMQHDEIRAFGWDPACAAGNRTAGHILADNVRASAGILAGSKVYVWGDMFDPEQNAVKDYYLVNGDLADSWDGVPREVTILNWNLPKIGSSLQFFARRGHEQVICGYYDGKPEDIRNVMREARDVPGVTGVMYTTWQDRYDDLEAFAKAARER